MQALSPLRPYLLRAHYDWLMDNELTPHLVVDATVVGTQVPQQYVKDGQIVLNIASTAVGNLELGNDWIEFHARFGGIPHHVWVPLAAVIAIYARENGAGIAFDHEEAYDEPMDFSYEEPIAEEAPKKPTLGLASHNGHSESTTNTDKEKPATEKKRPHLSVVK